MWGLFSSPGACIPVQVQNDRVTGSQGILVPHLALPLGSLPPDSGDSVPGNRSRGEQQDQMMMTVEGTTVEVKSQLSRQKGTGGQKTQTVPFTRINNY